MIDIFYGLNLNHLFPTCDKKEKKANDWNHEGAKYLIVENNEKLKL